ncbi:amidase signature enzyme [Sistotremastrum niveocremeum HHB9708]|uniref:Amidase signature enzyme n=1 Tax=Sistotremastrum niveocremeum HHB9708 TaxID=1314777 RepID=A0A164YBU4_9AGAM|nr:amidase signature enzyme [Sistotremastrum niveocremeum HHB9708]
MATIFRHRLSLVLIFLAVSYSLEAKHGGNPGEIFPDLYEASISDLQAGLAAGNFTSVDLVKGISSQAYSARIDEVNDEIHAVVEKNPSAIDLAHRLDTERRNSGPRGPLHGIPILIKDNIGTNRSEGLNTTAGSWALFKSIRDTDSFIVQRLKAAGAIILGKANLSEWAHYRGTTIPDAWSPRGGQGTNPCFPNGGTCGSSSGPSAAAAVGLAVAAIGTDTGGSISCPAGYHNVVGIKPTVGLTSRSGVIPITPRMDTVGPIARSVSDAATILSAMAGPDPSDYYTLIQPTPVPDFTKALNLNTIKGARIGVPRTVFTNNSLTGNLPFVNQEFENALEQLRALGATIVDPADLPSASYFTTITPLLFLFAVDFKIQIKKYLQTLVSIPSGVGSLSDLIQFNIDNADLEQPTPEYTGQDLWIQSQSTNGYNSTWWSTLADAMNAGGSNGIDAALQQHNLDALVLPSPGFPSTFPAAYAGYPMVTVPMSFYPDNTTAVELFPGIFYPAPGIPIGLAFFGSAFSEEKLIGLAYAYEQATKVRLMRKAYANATPKTQLKDVMED